jgi:excisionase family DNA binding protein
MTRWNRRTVSDRVESHEGPDRAPVSGTRSVPTLLTVDDVADLLRTTRRAVYAMVERRQLPGIVRIGRRVLVRADELLHWLDQKSASSLRSEQR